MKNSRGKISKVLRNYIFSPLRAKDLIEKYIEYFLTIKKNKKKTNNGIKKIRRKEKKPKNNCIRNENYLYV